MDRIYVFKNAEVYYGEDKTMTNLKHYFNYVRDFKIRITSDKVIDDIIFSKEKSSSTYPIFESLINIIIRNKDERKKSWSYVDWLKFFDFKPSNFNNIIMVEDFENCITGDVFEKKTYPSKYLELTENEEKILNSSIKDSHKPDEHWLVDLTRYGSCFISGSDTELDINKILDWEVDSSYNIAPFSLPYKKNGRRMLFIHQPELLTFICIDSSRPGHSQNYLNLYTHNNNNGIIYG